MSRRVCIASYLAIETVVEGDRKSVRLAGPPIDLGLALARLGLSVATVVRGRRDEIDEAVEMLRSHGVKVEVLEGKTPRIKVFTYSGYSYVDLVVEHDPPPMHPDDVEACSGSNYVVIAPLAYAPSIVSVVKKAREVASYVVLDVDGASRYVEGKRLVYRDWSDKRIAMPMLDLAKLTTTVGRLISTRITSFEVLNDIGRYGVREVLMIDTEGLYVGVPSEGVSVYTPYVRRAMSRVDRSYEYAALAGYIYALSMGLEHVDRALIAAALASLRIAEGRYADIHELRSYIAKHYGVDRFNCVEELSKLFPELCYAHRTTLHLEQA